MSTTHRALLHIWRRRSGMSAEATNMAEQINDRARMTRTRATHCRSITRTSKRRGRGRSKSSKNDLHIICEIQISFRGARNPVSSTRKFKVFFINVFIDIGKSIDIAVSQLFFDVMKSLFFSKFPTNNAKVMDDSPFRQTFESRIFISTAEEYPKFSKIVKFGCKTLQNLENKAL